MGFYGNITNTSKTQFQFDKIYANRYEMDYSKTTDGIYAGRYVLVEYDTNFSHDDYHQVRIINNQIYKVNSVDKNTLVKKGDFEDGDIVYTADEQQSPSTGYFSKNVIYYRINFDKNGTPVLTQLISTVNDDNGTVPNYTINYNIDIGKYGAGRGYDSTVWQKTYIDGYEKYIMIAELNSVVPTFDVSADAPTMAPLVPHFDTHSTDIYYKLHWQPSWGFRITEADVEEGKQSTTKSSDENMGKYPSDAKVSYDTTTYNPNTGENNKPTSIEYKGAIYFNKDGLDIAKHNYYDSAATGNFIDQIAIRPSGVSGNKYNKHDGSVNVDTAADIQEMRIILPSLGNTICHLWDMAYGYNGNNENKRYRDIEWKDAETGKENTDIGGMTRNLETIAGCINSAHDLMGMIITESIPEDSELEEAYELNRIYKVGDVYKRIQRVPKYTEVKGLVIPDRKNYNSDQEYNKVYKSVIDKALTNTTEKVFYAVKTEDGKQVARRINPYVSDSLDEGEALSYRNGYNYYYTDLDGFADDLTTVNGLILQLKNLIESDDSESRNKETVQGVVNSLNDIIGLFDDLIPGQPVIVDALGKVTSANWTTKQTFKYTNNGKNPNTTSKGAEAENQWIKFDLDKENRKISLSHVEANRRIPDTTTISNKNENGTTQTGLNKDKGNSLQLYTPIVDNCGHVVGKNIETVTLPYGYKTICLKEQSIKASNPEINTDSIIADDTQDTLTIASSNRWIRMSGNNTTDTLSIGHEVRSFEDGTQSDTYYGLEQNESIKDLDTDNTFEVPCLKFDEAGHITGAHTHTVQLPENFTTIKVTTNDDTDSDNYKKGGSAEKAIEADSLTDILTLAEGNRWINIDTDSANDKVTFSHYVKKFTPTPSTTDYNNAISKTFIVQELSYDNAGHITAVKNHSHTLPDSIKTITIANNGNKTVKTNETTKNDNLTAKTLTDTITFDTGNRWIALSADADNKKVTVYHTAPDMEEENLSSTITNNETPNFGGTFSIPEVKYDIAGHISSVGTHTVTMPKPSLNNITVTADSNVLTGLQLAPTTGTFTQTNADVGTLKLTGYAVATIKDDITKNNTINEAFGQAQYRITTLENDLDAEKAQRETDKTALKELINDKEDAGAAEAVRKKITGEDIEDKTSEEFSQTLFGLIFRVVALENKIQALENKIESLTTTS